MFVDVCKAAAAPSLVFFPKGHAFRYYAGGHKECIHKHTYTGLDRNSVRNLSAFGVCLKNFI